MTRSPLRSFLDIGMTSTLASESLDGQWRVVLSLRAGREGRWCQRLTIRGNTFSADCSESASGRIVLGSPPREPSAIDLVFNMESGMHSGDRIEGIYRLIGNQALILNLGLDARGEAHYARPTSFAVSSLSTLLVLLREE